MHAVYPGSRLPDMDWPLWRPCEVTRVYCWPNTSSRINEKLMNGHGLLIHENMSAAAMRLA